MIYSRGIKEAVCTVTKPESQKLK